MNPDDPIVANLAFIMRGSNVATLHTSLYESQGYTKDMSPSEMIDRYLSWHHTQPDRSGLLDLDRILFQRAGNGTRFCRFRSVGIPIFNVERIDSPSYKATQA